MTTAEKMIGGAAVEGAVSSMILQSILEANRDSAIVVDDAMRIRASNEAARLTFARQDDVLTGKRLSEVFRNVELHHSFRHVLASARTANVKIELGDPAEHIFDIHIAPIEIDGRRLAVGVFYDVTPIDRLERVRQEFLSNISHELRTPLTAILAFVETLEDGGIDDVKNNRRFLGVIRRNAERMHTLIADILELSQIESGSISIARKQVNAAALTDEVFANVASAAAERGVELESRIVADDRVLADPARLEQMLTNLIDNAIKFNRTGGRVTLAHEVRGTFSVISVADTGEGIPPEHLKRIFERFYRIDRGRTRDVGGTGLGLAIAKHLARLHGGEISVQSQLGRGTTFFIELPNY